MELVKSFMTNNPCYRIGEKITVRGMMLHSVGCPQPSAEVFVGLMNKASYGRACVHAFIDGNTGVVYQTLPWNYRGWHSASGSKGSANNTHIGVEMCEPSSIRYTGGSTFTCTNKAAARASVKRTYEAAVALFAACCKEFNLDPLADGVIISHKEGCKRGIASNHGDPEHLWNGLGMGYTMDGFRQDVKAAMSNGTPESQIMSNEWIQAEDGRWWYKHYDGTFTTNGWELINGKWYLFDAQGWMLTGWQQVKGTWYYLCGQGCMENGWKEIDGKWYFMDASGAMRTGWLQDGENWYFLGADGAMVTGWQLVRNHWYHLAENGIMDTGLFQDTDGRLYYLADDGHMCRTNESGALV